MSIKYEYEHIFNKKLFRPEKSWTAITCTYKHVSMDFNLILMNKITELQV